MKEIIEEYYTYKYIFGNYKIYLRSCTSRTLLVQGINKYYDP